jgi:hypothetical protein
MADDVIEISDDMLLEFVGNERGATAASQPPPLPATS